jgi:hypothetical protein
MIIVERKEVNIVHAYAHIRIYKIRNDQHNITITINSLTGTSIAYMNI